MLLHNERVTKVFNIYVSKVVHNILENCFDDEQRIRYQRLLDTIIRFQGNAGTFLGNAKEDVACYIGARGLPAAAAYQKHTFVLTEPMAKDGTVVFIAYYKGPPIGEIKSECAPIPASGLKFDHITIHDTSVIRRRRDK